MTFNAERHLLTVPIGNAPITGGMKIIFYDEMGTPLPLPSEIRDTQNGVAQVDMPWLMKEAPPFAKIVIAQDIAARRVPLTAMHDNAIWVAHPKTEGTYRIERASPLTGSLSNKEYMDVSGAMRADEFFIANPDDDLVEGQIISAGHIDSVEAPALDPQEQAYRLLEEERVATLLSNLDQMTDDNATCNALPLLKENNAPSSQPVCGACAAKGTQNGIPRL